MDSEPTTNRKGFIKRAGLALGAIFAVSSIVRTTPKGQAQSAAQGSEPKVMARAMARVRPAKGAVARKAV